MIVADKEDTEPMVLSGKVANITSKDSRPGS